MMAQKVYKSIASSMKGVDNAVALGCKRAINRSIQSTKTYITKSLRTELSLPSDVVRKRLIANKVAKGISNPYAFKASVAIAMKRLFPMRFFKPKQKTVKKNKRNYYGVTTKVGKGPRTLVPNGFLITLKNGTPVVAQRKGKDRSPIREVFSTVWQQSVLNKLSDYKKYLRDNFGRIVGQQIDYALSQKDKRDNKED